MLSKLDAGDVVAAEVVVATKVAAFTVPTRQFVGYT